MPSFDMSASTGHIRNLSDSTEESACSCSSGNYASSPETSFAESFDPFSQAVPAYEHNVGLPKVSLNPVVDKSRSTAAALNPEAIDFVPFNRASKTRSAFNPTAQIFKPRNLLNPAAPVFVPVIHDPKARPPYAISTDANVQATAQDVSNLALDTASVGTAQTPAEVNQDNDSVEQSQICRDGESAYRKECLPSDSCAVPGSLATNDFDNNTDSRLEYDPTNPLLSESPPEVPEVEDILEILRKITSTQLTVSPISESQKQERLDDTVTGTVPWSGPLVVSSVLPIKETLSPETPPQDDLDTLMTDAPELVDVGPANESSITPRQTLSKGPTPHHYSFFGQPAPKNATNTAISLLIIFGPAKAWASKQAVEDKFWLREHVTLSEARKLVDPVAIQGQIPDTKLPGYKFIESVTGMGTKLYGAGWWPQDQSYNPYEDDPILPDNGSEESYVELDITPANGSHPVPSIPTAADFIYEDYRLYNQMVAARDAKVRMRRTGPRLRSKLREDISEALLSKPATYDLAPTVRPEPVKSSNSEWARSLNLDEMLGQSATELDELDDCAIVSDDGVEAVPIQMANLNWSSSFDLGHLGRPVASTPAAEQVQIDNCQDLMVHRDPISVLETLEEASSDMVVAIYSPDEAEIAAEDAFIYDDAEISSIEDAPTNVMQHKSSELAIQRQAEQDIYDILQTSDALAELVEHSSDDDQDIRSEDDYIYGSSGHEVEQTSSFPTAQPVDTMQLVLYKSSADRLADFQQPSLPGLEILRAEQEGAQESAIDDASDASSPFISNPVTPEGSPYKRPQSNTPRRMGIGLSEAVDTPFDSDEDSSISECRLSDILEESLEDEEEEEVEEYAHQDSTYAHDGRLSDIPEESEESEDLGQPDDEDSGLYPRFLRLQQAAMNNHADSPSIPSLTHGTSSESDAIEDVDPEIAANESFSFFSLSEVWKYIENDVEDADDTVIHHTVYHSIRSSNSDVSLLDINASLHQAVTLFDTPPPSYRGGEESLLDEHTVSMLSFDNPDAAPLDLSFNADIVQRCEESCLGSTQLNLEAEVVKKRSGFSTLREKFGVPNLGLKKKIREMVKGFGVFAMGRAGRKE